MREKPLLISNNEESNKSTFAVERQIWKAKNKLLGLNNQLHSCQKLKYDYYNQAINRLAELDGPSRAEDKEANRLLNLSGDCLKRSFEIKRQIIEMEKHIRMEEWKLNKK